MRFDDLDLLRSIRKEEETSTVALHEGLSLIRSIVGGGPAPVWRTRTVEC
jgi:hypothetical protein